MSFICQPRESLLKQCVILLLPSLCQIRLRPDQRDDRTLRPSRQGVARQEQAQRLRPVQL